MTGCPPADRLQDLLAERVPPSERAALEQHLSACRTCQDSLATLTTCPDDERWRKLAGDGALRSDRVDRAIGLGGSGASSWARRVAAGRRSGSAGRADTPNLASGTHPDGRNGDAPPARLPGYEIVRELGRGGMGVVYEARQIRPTRLVALKMMLAGSHAGHDERRRLLAEAEAVARLHHPNIVQVFEAGEHDGLAYLALEYCPNGSLAAKLQGTPMPADEAAALVEILARTVHHAHKAGIVHRDLKPANVLLAADGTPKITDFGLAKRVDQDHGETRSGTLVGTPSYMSPEQARGKSGSIGPATDVYALGAVLYELLTGRPPFRAENACETLVQVVHHDPVSPRQLLPNLPRDLATVCLKCLDKDPKKRYPSAVELADDLRRFLDRRPITARPVGSVERMGKWARRSPAVAGLMASVVAVTVVGFALVFWQWTRAEDKATAAANARDDEAKARLVAEQNEKREIEARRDVEQISARLLIEQGFVRCDRGDVGPGLLLLASGLERAVRAGDADGERLARFNLAAWEPHFIAPRALLPHKTNVTAVAYRPDGKAVATGDRYGVVQVWDAEGRPLGPQRKVDHSVWCLAFRPDGRVLLAGAGDQGGEARLWDLEANKELGAVATPAPVIAASFAPGGDRFLTVCPAEARLWRTEGLEPASEPMRHQGGVNDGMLSADGRTVLTGGADRLGKLWDADTGLLRAELKGHAGPVLAVALSPDGRLAATAGQDKLARLWDATSGEPRGRPMPHQGPVRAVAFSPEGDLLATGSMHLEPNYEANAIVPVGGEARVWDRDGKLIGKPLPHPGPVWSVALSAGNRMLLTGSEDGFARFFLVGSAVVVGQPLRHDGTVRQVVFSPDGTGAVTASDGGGPGIGASGRLWGVPPSLRRGAVVGRGESARAVAFSRDSTVLVVGYHSGKVGVYDAGTGRALPAPPDQPTEVTAVAISPDNRVIATACNNGAVRLWDANGKPRHAFQLFGMVRAIAFRPDGQTVVAADLDGAIGHWRVADGALVGPAPAPAPDGRPRAAQMAFEPDAATLWATHEDGQVRRRDAATGEVTLTWPINQWWCAAFGGPDNRTVLNCTKALVQRWDALTGRPEGPQMPHPDANLWSMAVSRDGRLGVSGAQHGSARLWDLATGQPIGRLPDLHHIVWSAAFRPDGKMLALGGPGVTLWELPAPPAGSPEQVRLRVEHLTHQRREASGLTRDLSAAELDEVAGRLRGLE
jgi:eukaryotic-like serine/threonine-protein kinase